MKTLIKDVALYKDHVITEHQNIEVTDSVITGFPMAPQAGNYDEVSKAVLCWPCPASSIRIRTSP